MFLWRINAPDELKVINFSDEVTDLLHKVSQFPPVFLNESTLIMFSECAAPDLLTVNSRRRSFCGLQAAFIHSHLALWFNYFFFFFFWLRLNCPSGLQEHTEWEWEWAH